jgi:hypothetical protein
MAALGDLCAPRAVGLKFETDVKAGKAVGNLARKFFRRLMMTLSRRWVHGAVWVVLLMAGSLLARAQEVQGIISGTIVDAKGATVSGAVVTFTDTDRAFVERTVKTDKIGYYTAPSLPLGHYSVKITAKDFKTVTISDVVLHANDILKLNQSLSSGSAAETVAVTASLGGVNLGDGTSKGLVTGNQVRELPLANRNYESLITLQPGVSYGGTTDYLYMGASVPSGTLSTPIAQTPLGATPYSPDQAMFSINGDRPTENNWTIDGVDNVDRGANLTLITYPSVDAISEVSTLRGTYEAEFGRNGSAQINVITRSGSNALHGGVYEFFQNNIMNANDYFDKLAGNARPVVRYNDFGATLGGPIMIPHLYNGKNKAFFFFSEEIRRQESYGTSMSYVPTAAERAGNFGTSAVCGNFNPSTGACTVYTTQLQASSTVLPISTPSAAYLRDIYNKMPLPPSAADIAAGLDPHTLISNLSNGFNDDQELARIDYQLGKKTNIYFRYLHDDLPTKEGGGLFINGGMPGVSQSSTRSPGTQDIGHATIAARPTLLIDMGYGYTAGAILSAPTGLAAYQSPDIPPTITLPYQSTLGIVPSITFPTGAGNVTGVASAGIYNEHSVNHNGFGSLTKVYRTHTFKFGLSYNHYQKIENATGNMSPYPQGNFSFVPATISSSQLTALNAANGTNWTAPSAFDAEFANFLIGNVNGGFTQGSEALTPNLNDDSIELYGQDHWRASRRLTVDLGVRYSYFGQPYDTNRELSNFDPALYNTTNAETIASTGGLCTVAGQTTSSLQYTATGIVATYTLASCPNVNGLNAYQPNTVADPVDGMILGDPGLIGAENNSNSKNYPFTEPSVPSGQIQPSLLTHGSPFGEEIGQAEKHDWAPRVGFAYDLFGNGKTAVRGGYGVVYDQSAVNIYEQEIFNNPPYLYVNNYAATILNSPAAPAGSSTTSLQPPVLYATPLIYKTPYIQQFSLDVQDALTPTLTVDLGYFGDHGTHLQGRVDINENRPGAFAKTSIGYAQVPGCAGFTSQACEAPLNQIRPYLGYSAINAIQNIFNQNYNSLQLKVTKKFSGKSMIDANYTWSRGLTNAATDSGSAPQNSYNLAAEYGPTGLNRNQILTVDGIWELPWMRDQKGIVGHVVGGWQLTGIYAYNSGLPLTATMVAGGTVNYGGLTSSYNGQTNGGVATDAAGLGILNGSAAQLRPSVVMNPNSGANLHSRQHWFNQTAFVAPAPTSYQVGNEQRGSITGPGFNQFDLGVSRNFNLYRGWVFTLRGEGFNVLNHTNWANIDTTATSTTFGQAISARDPRTLQIAGKINF